MSFRKGEQILQTLRERILSGRWSTGTRLPTYDELTQEFQVARPTISRLLQSLREEGLITFRASPGAFVAERFPHHNRYYWATSEQPGSREWTSFLATFLDLIEHGTSGVPGEVVPLVGVDGRSNNPAYRLVCDVMKTGAAAGLLLVNSATVYQLPVLEAEGPPRVAICAALPHASLVSLAFDELIERACARLLEKGQRIAVVSPHTETLLAAEKCLLAKGLPKNRMRVLHVAPVGCERLTELLFDRPDRPDTVFVADDNLIEPLLLGLKRARVTVPSDVSVLAHCNWPRPIGLREGIEHIGFDVREIFSAAKACLDAQHGGEPSPVRVVPARFLSELTHGLDEHATREIA
ncbi:MAG TPA: GntR family transcriptional regulator [Polyangiaceae bacterium]|nr:GntR family transcriptional regulator [Polyangiaceae bacterium]